MYIRTYPCVLLTWRGGGPACGHVPLPMPATRWGAIPTRSNPVTLPSRFFPSIHAQYEADATRGPVHSPPCLTGNNSITAKIPPYCLLAHHVCRLSCPAQTAGSNEPRSPTPLSARIPSFITHLLALIALQCPTGSNQPSLQSMYTCTYVHICPCPMSPCPLSTYVST